MKDRLPHMVWLPETDKTSGEHLTDDNGDEMWRDIAPSDFP